MPELPEVETIRRQLNQALPGQRLVDWSLDTPKMLRSPRGGIKQHLIQESVTGVNRRAKLLILSFSSGWSLLIHLKMTGQAIFRPSRGRLRVGGHPIPHGADSLPNRFTRAVMSFRSGAILFFNDVRKFGYLRLVPTAGLKQHFQQLKLGIEPLTKEFTVDKFLESCRRYPNRMIYQLLMDQSLIAGLGNIYVTEACFAARIRPTRRVKLVTSGERRKLFQAIRRLLPLAIRHKGTTLSDYRDAHGLQGGMARHLKAYGKTGRPCPRMDGGIIQRAIIGSRSAAFCTVCQR